MLRELGLKEKFLSLKFWYKTFQGRNLNMYMYVQVSRGQKFQNLSQKCKNLFSSKIK